MNRCLLLFTAFIVLNGACKTTRNVQVAASDDRLGKAVDYQSLPQRKTYSEFLKIKRAGLAFSLNGGKEKLNAAIAIHRDSMMVFSVVPLAGIELLRIYCYRDSLLLLNRQDQSYVYAGITDFSSRYGIRIDYGNIQSIFSNEFFLYGQNDRMKFLEGDVFAEDNHSVLTYYRKAGTKVKIRQRFYINNETQLLEKVVVNDYPRKLKMTILYGDFDKFPEGRFPGSIVIHILEPRNNLRVELAVKRIEKETELRQPPVIPDKYTNITRQE